MARGKLRCIMGCLRLKSSYREKSLFSLNNVKPTSQKLTDLNLDWKEIYMKPRTFMCILRRFQYKVLNNALFLNKKNFLSLRN